MIDFKFKSGTQEDLVRQIDYLLKMIDDIPSLKLITIESSGLTTGKNLILESKVCNVCEVIQIVNPSATLSTPQLCKVCDNNLTYKSNEEKN